MALLDRFTKATRYKQMKKAFWEHFELTPEQIQSQHLTCLNVGGGYGEGHKTLEQLGFKVTSCDVEGDCEYCNLERKLPYRTDEFDFIVCLAVLEHLESYDFAMEELKRVARTGVVATTPSVYGKPVLDTLAAFRLVNKAHIDDHKHYLTKREIKRHNYCHTYFLLGLNQLAIWKRGKVCEQS